MREKLKRKARLVGILWHSAVALILAICLLPLGSHPAAALSPSDYFSFSYNVQFNKSQVTGTELFYATITAEATCTEDLPWPYSLASRHDLEVYYLQYQLYHVYCFRVGVPGYEADEVFRRFSGGHGNLLIGISVG